MWEQTIIIAKDMIVSMSAFFIILLLSGGFIYLSKLVLNLISYALQC